MCSRYQNENEKMLTIILFCTRPRLAENKHVCETMLHDYSAQWKKTQHIGNPDGGTTWSTRCS